MKHLIRWLFDFPEWVTCDGAGGLYRRFVRSRLVQYKDQCGWNDISRLTDDAKFAPAGDEGHLRMPDRGYVSYSRTERDSMGERAFEDWANDERRLVLQNMIRRKAKLVVK